MVKERREKHSSLYGRIVPILRTDSRKVA